MNANRMTYSADEFSQIIINPPQAESRGFCPTGAGGGIDNSCSSKDGGGGAVAAVGDTLKRKDVQVGQTISVQKHGQQTVHNGVVTGVKHEAAVSEITLRGADGKETTIRIRNLAQIRESNLGDSEKLKEKTPGGRQKVGKGQRPEVPKLPENAGKKERDAYKQEVKDFCKAHGVRLEDSLTVGKSGPTPSSLNEVATGINRLVNAGQSPPSVIVMTNLGPGGGAMGSALGYYDPGRPEAIFVSSRMPYGEPQGSINSGFLAGTGNSGHGTVIVHENGHRLHHQAIGDKEFDRLPRPPKRMPTTLSYSDHSVASQVSRYGATCEAEFVAETYSGHISGRRYSDEVYTLYNRYGGPRLPGVKVTKGGKVKVK
jgi:hypothetical protein